MTHHTRAFDNATMNLKRGGGELIFDKGDVVLKIQHNPNGPLPEIVDYIGLPSGADNITWCLVNKEIYYTLPE